MKPYVVYFGVGGGYGGIDSAHLIYAEDEEEAEAYASDRATESCESYGIGEDTETIEDYWEEINRWAVYEVEEYTGNQEQIDKMISYGFTNETDIDIKGSY